MGHTITSGLLEDYCDGEAFATHPLFSVHSRALQIFLYYDEVEVCNPLESKVKIHKIGQSVTICVMHSISTMQVPFISHLVICHQNTDQDYLVYTL